MLTDNEKVWLECREKSYGYYCMWCDLWCDERGANPFCYTTIRKEKFADAAEFSERVAAKLANTASRLALGIGHDKECTELCDAANICKKDEEMSCEWCFLKAARLEVEEEMDDAEI